MGIQGNQSREESMKLELVELASKQDGQTGQQCKFELDGPKGTDTVQAPTIIEDEEDSPKLENVAAEFLTKHHCLNHLSMAKMQVIAKHRILPQRWAKCDIPICTSCLYSKATRRPWRTKPKKDSQESKLRTTTEPGQCVSVDQLESRTPGLIAQSKGWLTKKRYQTATSNLCGPLQFTIICFLQKSTNSEEALSNQGRGSDNYLLRCQRTLSEWSG